jgi:hypothetical protein
LVLGGDAAPAPNADDGPPAADGAGGDDDPRDDVEEPAPALPG